MQTFELFIILNQLAEVYLEIEICCLKWQETYFHHDVLISLSSGARLGTARPGTKSGVAPGTGALASSVQVADRPMTQQVRAS